MHRIDRRVGRDDRRGRLPGLRPDPFRRVRRLAGRGTRGRGGLLALLAPLAVRFVWRPAVRSGPAVVPVTGQTGPRPAATAGFGGRTAMTRRTRGRWFPFIVADAHAACGGRDCERQGDPAGESAWGGQLAHGHLRNTKWISPRRGEGRRFAAQLPEQVRGHAPGPVTLAVSPTFTPHQGNGVGQDVPRSERPVPGRQGSTQAWHARNRDRTGQHRAAPGCTGLHRAAPGCTEKEERCSGPQVPAEPEMPGRKVRRPGRKSFRRAPASSSVDRVRTSCARAARPPGSRVPAYFAGHP